MYLFLLVSISVSEQIRRATVCYAKDTDFNLRHVYGSDDAAKAVRKQTSRKIIFRSLADRSLRLAVHVSLVPVSLSLYLSILHRCIYLSLYALSLYLSIYLPLSRYVALYATLTMPVVCSRALFLWRSYGSHWSRRRPSRPHRRHEVGSGSRMQIRQLGDLTRCLQSPFGQGRHCKAPPSNPNVAVSLSLVFSPFCDRSGTCAEQRPARAPALPLPLRLTAPLSVPGRHGWRQLRLRLRD